MMSCVLPCWLSEATIGIIIGSLFTLSGVFANGIVTYFLNRKAHKWEVAERKRCEQKKESDEKRAKREKAYRDFLNYYGLMNLLVGFICESKCKDMNFDAMRCIYSEKIKESFAKVADVISAVSLYGSGRIVKISGNYSALWNATWQKINVLTIEDCVRLDQELIIVVNEMKKELDLEVI